MGTTISSVLVLLGFSATGFLLSATFTYFMDKPHLRFWREFWLREIL